MIKTRKKSISLLVTLVFLLSVMLPAGAAFADTTYGTYSGAYNYVSAGTNQPAGYAQVKIKDLGSATKIYAKVVLPPGVTYNTKPTAVDADYVTLNGGTTNLSFADSADDMLQVCLDSPALNDVVKFSFATAGKSSLDIGSDVSGDIKATIEILGTDGTSILWVESESVTIAKVSAKEVTVTAGDPKIVETGVARDGAEITIKESMTRALAVDEAIYAQIETTDVSFNGTPTVTESQVDLYPDGAGVTVNAVGDDLIWFQVKDQSTVLPGKITIDLTGKLNIPPSVSGEIKVTIYSGKSGSKLSKTTVVVAKVGEVAATIKNVKGNTDVCYIGQKKALSAKFDLEAASGSKMEANKTVILELVNGKWDKDATGFWAVGTDYFGGKLTFRGLYNDDKTAWFTIKTATDKVTLDGFKVKAPGDAPAGDIVVKVSGSAGASGEAVIGKFAAPVTLSADKLQVKIGTTDQAAGDILIKEADGGVLQQGKYIALQLPPGITFSEVPTVKVTEGNLKKGDVIVKNDNILLIEVESKSGLASTIKISGIKYNVSKTAAEGDVALTLLGGSIDNTYNTINEVDAKSLGKVVNAVAVSPTAAKAVLAIGSTTMTVNGATVTMDVAPYIKDGRTYLPVRFVAKALGVNEDNILWDGATQTVTIISGATVIQMKIGSKVLTVNGASITMDAAPEIVPPGRTCLPIRFVAQALGATIGWDAATQTVTLVRS